MKFVIRKQLLNRPWGAADLDAAAEFWLRLYEAAAAKHGFTRRPDHRTEVRLRGFPRAEGPLLAAELARRAAASDFRLPVAELHDPDTLVLTSGGTPPAQAPPLGLGLPLLDGPGFDGLMAEIRITAAGAQGKLLTRARLSFTLVLVGHVVAGVFVLQALWRSGSSGWEDDVYWEADWPKEAEWLAAFDRFRETNAVPVKLAKAVCLKRDADRVGSALVKFFRVPFGRPRLAKLVAVWLVFLLIGGGTAALAVSLAGARRWLLVLALVPLPACVMLVFLVFLRIEAHLWFAGYRMFHRLYTKLSGESHRLVPPSPDQAAQAARNPTVQKYTADLQADGFVYAGDVVIDPPTFGECAFRVFRAPDGVSHLAVLFGFGSPSTMGWPMHTWPARVTFVAHTHFAGGGYVTSINGRSHGYRRKRTGPDVLVRVFPDVTDPLEFVRGHTRVATAFASANGLRALPNGSFADYVRFQSAARDDEQRHYAGSPYTWGDHLRWYLQTPRRVFRE